MYVPNPHNQSGLVYCICKKADVNIKRNSEKNLQNPLSLHQKMLNASQTAANDFGAKQCSRMNTHSAREYTMFIPAQLWHK
jgi:hypothetical protein